MCKFKLVNTIDTLSPIFKILFRDSLSFFIGDKLTPAFTQTTAGVVLVSPKALAKLKSPAGTALIAVPSVQHAFAAVAEMVYPDCRRIAGPFSTGVDSTAKIGEGVLLGALFRLYRRLIFGGDARAGCESGAAVGHTSFHSLPARRSSRIAGGLADRNRPTRSFSSACLRRIVFFRSVLNNANVARNDS